MPKIVLDNDNQSQIELSLTYDFITKYSLEKLVDLVMYPYGEHSITFYRPASFTVPFKFPYFQQYDEPFLCEFIELFNSVLESSSSELEKHADELLLLANTYVIANRDKYSDVYVDDVLRTRGKLLLNFIKAPLPKYTIETIKDAIYDHLDSYEKDNILLSYLSMLSGKPESEFKNTEGEIDFSTIDEDLQNKVIKRIVAYFNINIKLPEVKKSNEKEQPNFLIVSKDIKIDFSYNIGGKTVTFTERDQEQNIKFNTFIVKTLFKEQKEHNTEFYKALLEHDFFSGEYDKLNHSTNKYNTESQNIYNLNQLYSGIMMYLETEKLLSVKDPIITKRKRNNFIYQYLIMIGLPLNSTSEWSDSSSIKQIKERLSKFKIELSNKPLYSSTKFDNAFKNLNRKKKFI
jgi:hypothetical protein